MPVKVVEKGVVTEVLVETDMGHKEQNYKIVLITWKVKVMTISIAMLHLKQRLDRAVTMDILKCRR